MDRSQAVASTMREQLRWRRAIHLRMFEACRSYTKKRSKTGGARRDLEDLRAAIGHHAAGGHHREIVKASLPEKGEPRDKWLTRSDALVILECRWTFC